jgi:hypothetical protein
MSAKTMMDSLRHLESIDKEEESWQPRKVRIRPPTTNMLSYKLNQRTPQAPRKCRRRKKPKQIGKGKEGSLPEMNPNTSSTGPTTRIEDHLEIEDRDVEMDLDEQELAGVDLEQLEHAYRHQKLYTIPPDKL